MNLFSLYRLARPALFMIEPERAHNLSLAMLDRAQRLRLLPPAAPLAGRRVQIAGLSFPNPVGLAAGLDKNADHLDGLATMGFGFIEVGTVTPKPQPGNPRPRMFRIPEAEALINRLGFNNLGLETFLKNVQQSAWVKEKRGILGLNIGKNAATPMEDAANDYLLGLEAVFPYADYITINISSPNTKNLRQLQSDEALDRLLFSLKKMQASLALKHKRRVPLFLKIAPDLDPSEISRIANSVRQHDIEGVIATNTTVSRHQVAQYAHAEETGGLSGAPLLETANAVLRQLRGVLPKETCLIGVGGVVSGADAAEKIQAGADLVQVYTGLIYRGPALISDAVRATRSA